MLLVICVKDHEHAEMDKILRFHFGQNPRTETNEIARYAVYNFGSKLTKRPKKLDVTIILATFISSQGPVACSQRAAALLLHFANDAELSVDSIIMPGICGGTKLGRVIVCSRWQGLGARILCLHFLTTSGKLVV